MIQLNLEPQLEHKLAALVSETGRPLDSIVSQALESLIEKLEDIADAEAVLASKGRIWTHEEVMRDLGLED